MKIEKKADGMRRVVISDDDLQDFSALSIYFYENMMNKLDAIIKKLVPMLTYQKKFEMIEVIRK